MQPLVMRALLIVAWSALAVILWLTIASVAFLWLANLLADPTIPSWSRPWQWLAYLYRGHRDVSEDLYLIGGATAATASFVLAAQCWLRFGSRPPRSLYGDSSLAAPGEIRRGGGFRLDDKR